MSTPSLLNIPYLYKAGTLYSQIPESGAGDFSVSRTTTVANRSTRINKDGFIETVLDNVPRLDYPLGGAVNGCPALLVEPVATNLYQQSEDFSNVYWTKINCVASGNLTIAPDGNLTADKLIMGNGINPSIADQSGITRPGTITSGTYRFSVFAKAAEFTGFRVRENAINGTFLDVNLTNGAITNPDVTQFINPLAENYGNGWYRISWTSPTITSLAKYTIRVGSTGDGVSGIFVWGAQVETGSVATSYIPTTTASVTRSAEIITDTTASALIGQGEGTIYAEVDVRNFVNFSRVVALSDGTGSNSIGLQLFLNGAVKSLRVGLSFLGGGQVDIIAAMPNAVNKIAVGYKQNDFVVYLNGTNVGTDTSCSVPAMNKIDLGNINGVNIIADRIREVELHPNRIPNTAAPGVLSLATLTAL
jgi:hypothetical protein